jgi:AraC-like DNA-binding protein
MKPLSFVGGYMIYHTEGSIMFMITQLMLAGITKDECKRLLGFSVASVGASLVKKVYNNNVFKLYQVLDDIGYQKNQELQVYDQLIHSDDFHAAFLANSINFSDFIHRCELLCKSNTSVTTFYSSVKNDRFYINIHRNAPELSFYSPQGFFFLLGSYAADIFHIDIDSLDAEISVSQSSIPDEERVVRYVTDKISTTAKSTYISFPVSLLGLENSGYNPHVSAFINKHFDQIYGISRNGALDKLQSVVCNHIGSLLTDAYNELSIDVIAKRMNMSRSTLYRNLVNEGVTFSELVEIARRNFALNYIKQSNMSLSEISDRLGYSNLSAFTRAFKRWYDVAPSCFRHENKKQVVNS